MAYLIGQNADYLAHAISIRLHRASRGDKGHCGAIRVLGAVVQHGEEGVCAMVRDCIDDLLTSLDTKQVDAALVWAGLRTLARSCECFVSSRNVTVGMDTKPVGVVKEEQEENGVERQEVGIEGIADYFMQYHKTKEETEGKEEAVGGVAEEEPYSQEQPLPAVEQVCVEVMRRCGHHMSHDQPNIRLVVMDTLQHCMRALRHNEVRILCGG